MPGVIESGDPGESPVSFFPVVRFSSSNEPPTLDAEDFVDRLRFMGLDRDFVDEAQRRLRLEGWAGMEWVQQRLEELRPPRQPPSCDCGEPLVGLDWRGRATVRCGVCGSRWGLDVRSEQEESIWGIAGPSDEWRAAHPIEEFDSYGEFRPRGCAAPWTSTHP